MTLYTFCQHEKHLCIVKLPGKSEYYSHVIYVLPRNFKNLISS